VEGAWIHALSPDGQTLFTVEGERFTVREVATGRVLYQMPEGDHWEFWGAHPEGRRFVIATTGDAPTNMPFEPRSVYTLDLDQGRHELVTHGARAGYPELSSPAVLPYGFPIWRMLEGERDQVELIWNPWEGQSRALTTMHWRSGTVLGPQLSLSPDGRDLVIQGGSGDERWYHWDLRGGQGLRPLSIPGWVGRNAGVRFAEGQRAFFLHDPPMLVTLEGEEHPLPGQPGERRQRSAMLLSPDGTLAAWSEGARGLLVVDLAEGFEVTELGQVVHPDALSFDAQGDLWFMRLQEEDGGGHLAHWGRGLEEAQFVSDGLEGSGLHTFVWSYNRRQGTFLGYLALDEEGQLQTRLRDQGSQRELALPGAACNIQEDASQGGQVWLSTERWGSWGCQVVSAVSPDGQVQARYAFSEQRQLQGPFVSPDGALALVATTEEGPESWRLQLLARQGGQPRVLHQGGQWNVVRRGGTLAYTLRPLGDPAPEPSACVVRW
jgi:hypothetical protein